MTDRSIDAVANFLQRALAGGPLYVAALDAKARAARLLGDGQQIQHAKRFKRAKTLLKIKSARSGFGAQGKWTWSLPTHSTPAAPDRTISRQAHPLAASVSERAPTELETPRIPSSWVEGIARLDYRRPPIEVPLHSWRQFVDDCNKFLSSSANCAERAAKLGWDALALFGCRRIRPLDHLGSAGLLWTVKGDRVIKLDRDWAVIDREAGGAQRVHHRRRMDAANVTLPWIGLPPR